MLFTHLNTLNQRTIVVENCGFPGISTNMYRKLAKKARLLFDAVYCRAKCCQRMSYVRCEIKNDLREQR